MNFGPAERARMVKQSVDICEKKGVARLRLHPEDVPDDLHRELEGLFAYYQYAEASFILTCRTPDGTGSGWAGITGVKDISRRSTPRELTEIAADKALKSQKPRAHRAGPLHGDPRAAPDGAVPVADDGRLQRAARPERRGRRQLHFSGTASRGDDARSARSCSATTSRSRATSATRSCGRRRSAPTAWPAKPVTWVEKGVLKNLFYDRALGEAAEEGRRRRRART